MNDDFATLDDFDQFYDMFYRFFADNIKESRDKTIATDKLLEFYFWAERAARDSLY